MLIRFELFLPQMKIGSNGSLLENQNLNRKTILIVDENKNCKNNKSGSITVILCIFSASSVIARLEKNVTLISNFDVKEGEGRGGYQGAPQLGAITIKTECQQLYDESCTEKHYINF